MFATSVFVPVVAMAVTTLIYLVWSLQKENSRFVEEVKYFLRQRTIAHNRAKAQLAVLKTHYAKLEKEYVELRKRVGTENIIEFSGALGQADFVEVRKQRIAQLEDEIVELKKLSARDFA